MIKQCRFSKAVKFFEQDFCDRWGLKHYYSQEESCLFAGVYKPEDVEAINNHKGFKVIWNNGNVRNKLFNMLDEKNLVVCKYTNSIDHSGIDSRFRIVPARFEIKDYSLFAPEPLGQSVCVYLGNEKSKHIMGFDEVIKLKKITKHPIIISMQGHTRAWVKENIYARSFVNFKPVKVGGVETANELALMGRKTVSIAEGEGYINYNTIEEAANLIELEAKKIGTNQGSVLPKDYFRTGEEWLNEKFWT